MEGSEPEPDDLKSCLRCNVEMQDRGVVQLHEGKRWGILGNLAEVLTHRVRLQTYVCPQCKRVEWFALGPIVVPEEPS